MRRDGDYRGVIVRGIDKIEVISFDLQEGLADRLRFDATLRELVGTSVPPSVYQPLGVNVSALFARLMNFWGYWGTSVPYFAENRDI